MNKEADLLVIKMMKLMVNKIILISFGMMILTHRI